jgi:23S rRNA (cytosine1962-C5)-methyltransferase
MGKTEVRAGPRVKEPHVVLKPGKDKPVRQRHPWVFSGAIAHIVGEPADGDLVSVLDSGGQWLACGYLNRRSQIIVRLLSWQHDETVNDNFWRGRLQRALHARQALAASQTTNAYRLVNAESDGLPGLIVDRYGDWLVVQFLTVGLAQRQALFVRLLDELLSPAGIYERSDVDVRSHEGLSPATGLLSGLAPPSPLWITENGLQFGVSLAEGQKTGFYLDQRENRAHLARALAAMPGARVLNCFSYTGAFSVYALAAGAAHVTNLDSSYPALVLAEENLRRNGFDPDQQANGLAGDVFQVLRDLRGQRVAFDAVILDPPKFAHTQAQVLAATRGYKDINLLALHLVRPGGLLATFSCSGLVSTDLFQKVVFGAALDARREVQVSGRFTHSADHPVLLSFPEGEYLKGLLCQVW